MTLIEKCQRVRLFLSDVDGVLTDGSIEYDNERVERKRFHARDGLGVRLWQKAGLPIGLVTARRSRIVELRAVELDIDILRMGEENKRQAVLGILEELDMPPEDVCYLGDDLNDLSTVRMVGLGLAVADACEELCDAADHVTTAPGGRGALREAIELILKAQGRWEEILATYE